MKKTIWFLLIFTITVSGNANGFKRNGDLVTEELFPIQVNGTNQWLLIRGKDLSKPVFLYLHGGPGQSLIPFAHVATGNLTKDFIVVYWDQRGAGLSYHKDIPPETMNINQFIEDTHVVTEYLKKRFKKDKIYILGHSWGSLLGIRVVQKYPRDYYAYIGVGQVVNYQVQSREGVQWLKKRLMEEGTPEEKAIIPSMEASNFAPRDLLSKYGGVVHCISGERLSIIRQQSPYFPEKYPRSLFDQGLRMASGMWHREVVKADLLKQVPELTLPVYFFLGRYDYVTPTHSILAYYHDLKAPLKQVIWFECSGHRMDVEEPEKFQDMIREVAKSNG